MGDAKLLLQSCFLIAKQVSHIHELNTWREHTCEFWTIVFITNFTVILMYQLYTFLYLCYIVVQFPVLCVVYLINN